MFMPSNEVDRALAAPPEEVGRRLCDLPEDQWFERKSIRIAPKDLAITLVAMGNAEGGTIVIGLHRGVVEGVRHQAEKVNTLRQASLDHTAPPVRAHFQQVRCVNASGELDTLLIARVDPGEVVHELTNGECYLRVGDESRRLSFVQRQELAYDRGQAQYEGEAVPARTVEDLDAGLLRIYRKAAHASCSHTQLLKARGLVRRDGTLTNGAYLLFSSHPQELFPNAHVRILRFLRTERGTGSRLGLDEDADRRVEGPIPTIITEAAKVIEAWVPRRRRLSSAGVFEPESIVPRDVWLEGLVNAVVHRSYSNAGDHIRVEIYPDRVEIESPGRFPGLADPSRPLEISRFARNPRIARVCADLRIGQELGEGIRRMFEEMRSHGLADPLFTQTSGSVRLILPAVSRLDPAVEKSMPVGALDALLLLRRVDAPISTGQVQSSLGVSRPTAIRYLKALREAGLVSWRGLSPQDPHAAWYVTGSH